MKKLFSLMLAIIICLISLISCAASGKSILISRMFTANKPLNILNFYDAYTENLKYTNKDNEIFEYSIYIENSAQTKGSNNIIEKYTDMVMYAYEGNIILDKEGTYYSIIQLFGTYNDFIFKYINTRDTDFDNLTYYQKYSKEIVKDGIKYTEVGYQAVITPALAAKYSTLGLEVGNDILIVYLIKTGSNLFSKLTYYQVSKTETKEFLKRSFTFLETKTNSFTSLPLSNETVDITFIISADNQKATNTFKAFKGTKLGVETNDKNLLFYSDEDMTTLFDFDTLIIDSPLIIYGRYE